MLVKSYADPESSGEEGKCRGKTKQGSDDTNEDDSGDDLSSGSSHWSLDSDEDGSDAANSESEGEEGNGSGGGDYSSEGYGGSAPRKGPRKVTVSRKSGATTSSGPNKARSGSSGNTFHWTPELVRTPCHLFELLCGG